MSLYTSFAAVLSLRVSSVFGLPGSPLPPSQDPFYTAPQGFEQEPPGTILRQREAPGNLIEVIGNCSAAYNIVYRTTGARHDPSWAVTTLFIPLHTSGALLSYQMPYNTPDVDHSPSYILYNPDPSSLSDIIVALSKGWYVNVPDHEGYNAAFGGAVGNGFATLDSVRAVLNRGDLPQDTQYALWGYSGGSVASESAAELQVVYAPELHISGAALGGLASNLRAIFSAVNSKLFAGLNVLLLLGFGNEYPVVKEHILSHLKPEGLYNKTGFLAGLKMSSADAIPIYRGQDIWEYFDISQNIMDDPAIMQVINDNGYMGFQGTPKIPLFIYKAINDEVTPIDSTDALVDRYCSVGVNILYERNTIGNHGAEQTYGRPRAFDWLTKVLNGTLEQTDCTTRDVTVNTTVPAS